jgi:murein DD-endopeptidase MepM/ murein hydrolase activator NlpD
MGGSADVSGRTTLGPGAALRGRFRGVLTDSGGVVQVRSGWLAGTLAARGIALHGSLAGRVARARRRQRLLGRGLAALSVVALSAGLALAAHDYGRLLRQRDRMAALERRVAEQDAAIAGVHARLGEIRREVAAWQALHVQIWEPFGPRGRTGRPEAGVGGALLPDTGGGDASLAGEVDRLAAAVAEEGRSLRALARLMARAGRALASLPSRWPIAGPVNSEFGRRASPWTGQPELHRGIDIDASRGTPVRAPAPARVIGAGRHGQYGLAVQLDHGHGVRSLYAHLDTVLARRGQRVERGQVIGLSGNTGRSSGPHLHYEVWVHGRPVNPRSFLWERS